MSFAKAGNFLWRKRKVDAGTEEMPMMRGSRVYITEATDVRLVLNVALDSSQEFGRFPSGRVMTSEVLVLRCSCLGSRKDIKTSSRPHLERTSSLAA